jgi:hypothetical protein
MTEMTSGAQTLIEKAFKDGFVYDTGNHMKDALRECTSKGWLVLKEGGRFYLTVTCRDRCAAAKTTFVPQCATPERVSSEARALTQAVRASNGVTHEIDGKGMHRIVLEDGKGGNWALYESPAISPCGNYIAFTAYFDGDLPVEKIITITPLPSYACVHATVLNGQENSTK